MHTAILFLFTVLLTAGEPEILSNAPLVPLSAITDKEVLREISLTYPPEVVKRLQFYEWDVSKSQTIDLKSTPSVKLMNITFMKNNVISDGLGDITAYTHLEYSSNILDGFFPLKRNTVGILSLGPDRKTWKPTTVTFKVKSEKVYGTIYIPTVVN